MMHGPINIRLNLLFINLFTTARQRASNRDMRSSVLSPKTDQSEFPRGFCSLKLDNNHLLKDLF